MSPVLVHLWPPLPLFQPCLPCLTCPYSTPSDVVLGTRIVPVRVPPITSICTFYHTLSLPAATPSASNPPLLLLLLLHPSIHSHTLTYLTTSPSHSLRLFLLPHLFHHHHHHRDYVQIAILNVSNNKLSPVQLLSRERERERRRRRTMDEVTAPAQQTSSVAVDRNPELSLRLRQRDRLSPRGRFGKIGRITTTVREVAESPGAGIALAPAPRSKARSPDFARKKQVQDGLRKEASVYRRAKREAEDLKFGMTPDGGSAGREGRQFTVANVGNNGRIYLR